MTFPARMPQHLQAAAENSVHRGGTGEAGTHWSAGLRLLFFKPGAVPG